MTCEDAMMLISGHLDGVNTQEEEAELFAHLNGCSSCRLLLEAFEAADAGILSLEAEPPVDLSERILSAVQREPRRRGVSRAWLVPAVTAAALAVVLWAGMRELPQMGSDTAAANTVSLQLARTDTTAVDTATSMDTTAESSAAEEESLAVPEAVYDSEAVQEEPASAVIPEPDSTGEDVLAYLNDYASQLCETENVAVLALQEKDASLEAYDRKLSQDNYVLVQLPDSETWEDILTAHPDASVFMPEAEPDAYFVVMPGLT